MAVFRRSNSGPDRPRNPDLPGDVAADEAHDVGLVGEVDEARLQVPVGGHEAEGVGLEPPLALRGGEDAEHDAGEVDARGEEALAVDDRRGDVPDGEGAILAGEQAPVVQEAELAGHGVAPALLR
ncbi:MAG: hypothetical protein R3F60_23745 [bacterium]